MLSALALLFARNDCCFVLKMFKLYIMQIVLNKVLLVGTKTTTYIGKPVVTNAAVHAVVEEQVSHYIIMN